MVSTSSRCSQVKYHPRALKPVTSHVWESPGGIDATTRDGPATARAHPAGSLQERADVLERTWDVEFKDLV